MTTISPDKLAKLTDEQFLEAIRAAFSLPGLFDPDEFNAEAVIASCAAVLRGCCYHVMDGLEAALAEFTGDQINAVSRLMGSGEDIFFRWLAYRSVCAPE